MFLATNLVMFTLGMVLYHFTTFVLAPLDSYITAASGKLTVARALTFSSAVFHAGSIVGALVGGLLGESFGIKPLFGIAAIFFIISAGVVLLTHAQPTEPKEGRRSILDLTQNTIYIGVLVVGFVAFFAMYLSWPLTPNYLQSERGVSLEQIGLFGSLHALGIVISNLALGLLDPRLGFPISQLTVGASVLLIWRGLSWPLYALGYLLAGSLYAARGLLNAVVETLVHRAQLGLAFGVAETVYSTTYMIAPPLAGLLYEQSKALPFQVSLILIGFSLVLTILLNSRLSRRVAQASV
jgi:MFS family permease